MNAGLDFNKQTFFFQNSCIIETCVGDYHINVLQSFPNWILIGFCQKIYTIEIKLPSEILFRQFAKNKIEIRIE